MTITDLDRELARRLAYAIVGPPINESEVAEVIAEIRNPKGTSDATPNCYYCGVKQASDNPKSCEKSPDAGHDFLTVRKCPQEACPNCDQILGHAGSCTWTAEDLAAAEREADQIRLELGLDQKRAGEALPEADATSRDHQLVTDLLEKWRVDSAFCFMVRGQLAKLLAQVREEERRSCSAEARSNAMINDGCYVAAPAPNMSCSKGIYGCDRTHTACVYCKSSSPPPDDVLADGDRTSLIHTNCHTAVWAERYRIERVDAEVFAKQQRVDNANALSQSAQKEVNADRESLEACAMILDAQDPPDARLYPGLQHATRVLRELATRVKSSDGFNDFMNGEASAQSHIADWLEREGGYPLRHFVEALRKGEWRPIPQRSETPTASNQSSLKDVKP